MHGEAQRDAVVAASQALFGRGSLEDLDEATLAAALAELPQVVVAAPAGGATLPPLVELLADSGLCASRSAARRAIAEGGAYVNNTRIADEGQVPGEGDLLPGRWLVLRRGKRHLAGRRRRADSRFDAARGRLLVLHPLLGRERRTPRWTVPERRPDRPSDTRFRVSLAARERA